MSLVVADLTRPTPRNGFLEMIRHSALNKLAESRDPDGRDCLLPVMTDQFAAVDQACSIVVGPDRVDIG